MMKNNVIPLIGIDREVKWSGRVMGQEYHAKFLIQRHPMKIDRRAYAFTNQKPTDPVFAHAP